MKKIGLTVLVLAVMLGISCKSFDNPNGPTPIKQYSLEITYLRINVTRPDALFSTPWSDLGVPNGQVVANISFDKVDDYTFKGGTPGQISTGIYGLSATDFSRGDCLDDGACKVGDRFVIRVRETGFQKEITSIVPFTLPTALKTGKARMCKFQLTDDGKVENAY